MTRQRFPYEVWLVDRGAVPYQVGMAETPVAMARMGDALAGRGVVVLYAHKDGEGWLDEDEAVERWIEGLDDGELNHWLREYSRERVVIACWTVGRERVVDALYEAIYPKAVA